MDTGCVMNLAEEVGESYDGIEPDDVAAPLYMLPLIREITNMGRRGPREKWIDKKQTSKTNK
jgi:hypothetical protein